MLTKQHQDCLARQICTSCGSRPPKTGLRTCQFCLDRKAAAYKARGGKPPSEATWAADTRLLRELMREHTGRHLTRARELFARVRDDFGTVGERRLWRVLAWHCAHGSIMAVGAKYAPARRGTGRYDSEGYVRGQAAGVVPGQERAAA